MIASMRLTISDRAWPPHSAQGHQMSIFSAISMASSTLDWAKFGHALAALHEGRADLPAPAW
jgi:hypothetical protein